MFDQVFSNILKKVAKSPVNKGSQLYCQKLKIEFERFSSQLIKEFSPSRISDPETNDLLKFMDLILLYYFELFNLIIKKAVANSLNDWPFKDTEGTRNSIRMSIVFNRLWYLLLGIRNTLYQSLLTPGKIIFRSFYENFNIIILLLLDEEVFIQYFTLADDDKKRWNMFKPKIVKNKIKTLVHNKTWLWLRSLEHFTDNHASDIYSLLSKENHMTDLRWFMANTTDRREKKIHFRMFNEFYLDKKSIHSILDHLFHYYDTLKMLLLYRNIPIKNFLEDKIKSEVLWEVYSYYLPTIYREN